MHEALGLGLLLLLLADIFVTVFQPHGYGGPLNRVLGRRFWAVTSGAARRFPGHRGRRGGRILSLAGPLVAVGTIVSWSLLLVLGFALLYYPHIDRFVVSSGAPGTPWIEAAYFSGYTASTLGLGDLAPPAGALRLVTVVEAMSGFILFGVSVTYVLAVYREVANMTTLALDIAGHAHPGVDRLLEAARSRDAWPQVAAWLETTAASLFRASQAHTQYPILLYFHAGRRTHSLPVQVGTLIELVDRIRALPVHDPAAALARHPTLVALHAALERQIEAIGHMIPPGYDALDADAAHPLARRHRRILRYIGFEA